MRIIWVIGVILLAAALFAAGWFGNQNLAGAFHVYQLGDGRTVVALRDLNEVYPVYGKTVKAGLDLAMSQKKEILNSTAGGKYETGAVQLYDNLDAINNDVRSALVGSYSGLITKISSSQDPAVQSEAFRQWDETLQLVIKEAFEVRKIDAQLSAVKKNISGEEWQTLFAEGEEAKNGATALKNASLWTGRK